MDEQETNVEALIADGKLGESDAEFRFAGREQLRDLSLALCRQARRKVLIFSHQLDPNSYNSQAMYEALKDLALHNPNPSLQIILQDNDQLRRGGHRLLELAQRLSSRVQIYRPHLQQHLDHMENFLVVDETGFVRQPLHSRPEGIASFNQPARARELSRFFDEVWQHSESDSLLRRLSI